MPWLTEHVPAADPTPRVFVALEAMAAGPRPALFVGRPCYFDANQDPGCAQLLWTHRRFAPEVIASMAAALRGAIAAHEWSQRPVVFVGFSGGGTLAALLAREFDRTCALITMASPLDIDEWTRERGYSPLEGSVNPAAQPPLPAHVRQLHLRGGRDRVVGAKNGSAYRQRNPWAEFRIVEGNAHGRDWLATWAALAPELGRLGGGCMSGPAR